MLKPQSTDWQAGLICHGDRGIARALEAIAHARREAPGRDLRHRLEHAYLWNPEVMDRMDELGVIWNTQPPVMELVGRDGAYAQWAQRARYAFPFKWLTERGGTISGGSDWRVAPNNPLIPLHNLV